MQDATLKDLGHQAALIVGEERNALSPLTHLPQLRPYLARQHERYLLDTSVLSVRRAATSSRSAGRSPAASNVDGTAYYYAAEPVGTACVHPAPAEEPDDTRAGRPSSRRS